VGVEDELEPLEAEVEVEDVGVSSQYTPHEYPPPIAQKLQGTGTRGALHFPPVLAVLMLTDGIPI